MWQVVCVGPSPMDRIRRVVDKGPLLPDLRRANSIAGFLRSTGLYESVKVEGSSARLATAAAPGGADQSFKPSGDGPADHKSRDEQTSAATDPTTGET